MKQLFRGLITSAGEDYSLNKYTATLEKGKSKMKTFVLPKESETHLIWEKREL